MIACEASPPTTAKTIGGFPVPGIGFEALACEIEAATGRALSRQYLGQLYTGQKTNPSFACVVALARYFGVELAAFLDPGHAGHIEASPRSIDAAGSSAWPQLSVAGVGLH